MDDLHGGPSRAGSGDLHAYPGNDLNTTFRSMVGVPIFNRGGKTEIYQIDEPEEETQPADPSRQENSRKEDPSREEFLSKYRVIGILKVEGKEPQETPNEAQIDKELNDFQKKENEWQEEWKQGWSGWVSGVREAIKPSQSSLRFPDTPFPEFVRRDKDSPPNEPDKNQGRRKRLADVMTRLCHAEFTHQDLELLVLFAMQVGRIIPISV